MKRPPAATMDGFDMRGLQVGRVYVLSDAHARYLIENAYAETLRPRVTAQARQSSKKPKA